MVEYNAFKAHIGTEFIFSLLLDEDEDGVVHDGNVQQIRFLINLATYFLKPFDIADKPNSSEENVIEESVSYKASTAADVRYFPLCLF